MIAGGGIPLTTTGDPRPSWDAYFLDIARVVATRADCTRRQAGAVIVVENRIISTGYNGAPAGDPGCLSAGACPRGQLTYEELKAHSSYDEGLGYCVATHAEVNALLHAGQSCRGATLYVVPGRPCVGCWRSMKSAGLVRVVWAGIHQGEQPGEWIKECRP